MKNLIAIISVVAIVFASCTSSKNGMILKRKYNKGYYVSNHHKANDVKKAETTKTTPIEKSESMSSVAIVLPNTTTDLEIKTQSINTINTVVKTESSKQIKHNTILVDAKNEVASVEKTAIKKAVKQIEIEKNKTAKGSGDANLVLLVILSLFPFLALLAMYLKDGKQITLNFWVDLIFHLTFIGYIIFALLVVFDVVNLA